jgi:hypothetical protein
MLTCFGADTGHDPFESAAYAFDSPFISECECLFGPLSKLFVFIKPSMIGDETNSTSPLLA